MNYFFKAFLVLALCSSCSAEPKALRDMPDAEKFWNRFVESYESGDEKKLLSCFAEPHSELVKTYAKSESTQVRFVKSLLDKFGKKGLRTFNDHNVIGGSTFSWPSIFSSTSPKVIKIKRNGFILDDYGWILDVEKGKGGSYQIVNADSDRSFGSMDVDKLNRVKEAYGLGIKTLNNDSFSLEDIPTLRSKVFEVQLGIPKEKFRRF